MSLEIRETFVNETKGYQFGESGWYEPFTDDCGELYRSLRREYGRATRMYREQPNGPDKVVGWVFSKRCEYEDYRPGSRHDRFYVREVWVEMRDLEAEERAAKIALQQIDCA